VHALKVALADWCTHVGRDLCLRERAAVIMPVSHQPCGRDAYGDNHAVDVGRARAKCPQCIAQLSCGNSPLWTLPNTVIAIARPPDYCPHLSNALF
jgi:hypothetical protein